MKIREDIKQLKTDPATLRKFGLLVGGVFVVIGLLFLIKHKDRTPYFVAPGAILMFAGAVLPRALKWVYIAWMSAAFVLGFVMAHVILTVLFYLLITPIGLVARLAGKDFLQAKLDRSRQSYWLPRERHERTARDYERQF